MSDASEESDSVPGWLVQAMRVEGEDEHRPFHLWNRKLEAIWSVSNRCYKLSSKECPN